LLNDKYINNPKKLEETDTSMNDQAVKKGDISILKKIETDLVKWLLFGVLSLMGTGIVFYFDTKNTDLQQSKDIKEVKEQLGGMKEQLNSISSMPQLNSEQMKSVQQLLQDVRDRQQRVEERQDKMYDILLEMAKKDKK